jgi:hypothetical protein
MARLDVDRLKEAKEWLGARLEGRNPTYREVMDDAVYAGFKQSEVEWAKKALGVISKRVGMGGPMCWSLPRKPAVFVIPAPEQDEAAARRARNLATLAAARAKRHPPKPTPPPPPDPPVVPEVVAPGPVPGPVPGPSSGPVLGLTRGDDARLDKPKRKVEDLVKTAANLIKRRSPTAARYLRDLADTAAKDAPACPACGRGTPRGEELRLKAVLAILDRAGVVAPRGGVDLPDSGPLIIFPPGTSIAVVAKPPEMPAVDLIAQPAVPGVRLTRGDRLGRGFDGAAEDAASDAASDGGCDA